LITRLFAYGTLLPGLAPTAMQEVVERMRPVGPAAVRGRLFDLGPYPGLVLDVAAGAVHGQLLDVPDDPELWLRMDAYEGFVPDDPARSLFRRVMCRATFADGSDTIDCWVYVYNGNLAGARQVTDGIWRPHRSAAEQGKETRPVKSRRPIIGVTLDYSHEHRDRYMLPQDYASSIERAGGLPLAIPFKTDLSLIPEIVDALDGVLFTGGDDLDPALYGETWHPNAEHLDPARQHFELALMAEVERRRIPALGVCLGSQLMNVYRGGSLIQFLPEVERPDALEHRKLDDPARRHAVRIEPDTVLGSAIGRPEILANTRHKQSVKRLGRGLRVNATAPDGVIEGFEDPSMPLFLAVQWHPENLSTQPEHLAPFKLLVERARG
jgi:putative glutamine amidotransferase